MSEGTRCPTCGCGLTPGISSYTVECAPIVARGVDEIPSAHEPAADDPPSPEHLRLLNAALYFVPRDRQIHKEIVALMNRPSPPPGDGQ